MPGPLLTRINHERDLESTGFALGSRAVCWLLKQARATVDENEEAASSNRPMYEARHMPSAGMAS